MTACFVKRFSGIQYVRRINLNNWKHWSFFKPNIAEIFSFYLYFCCFEHYLKTGLSALLIYFMWTVYIGSFFHLKAHRYHISYASLDEVANFYWSNSCRSTCENDVTRFQRKVSRNIADERGDVEYHVLGTAFL